MQIQLDGQVTDPDDLIADLRTKGHQILNIHISRWLTVDAHENTIDAGGRIDIEIEDHFAMTIYSDAIRALDTELKINPRIRPAPPPAGVILAPPAF